jgi:hypothetical protein
MSERDVIWQEHRLEEILYSNADPVSKVQQIIRLGFDPEVADEIVERHQMGTQSPVYYERLDFADLDDVPLTDEQAEAAESAEKTRSDYDQAA